MKNPYPFLCATLMLVVQTVFAQIPSGVYTTDTDGVRHEIKMDDGYFVYSEYKTSPAAFIRTLGGFASVENTIGGDKLVLLLEFNSEYAQDSIRTYSIPVRMDGEILHLDWFDKLILTPAAKTPQDLDGQWLFATRGPDTGQERRGESNTRKTLKFLLDGHFQWIAYDTEGFRFSGTGGGSYTAVDGSYTENIAYFSKDNTRVGASLTFDYELKGTDWHHTGNNSKGEPLYEIWGKRPRNNE